MEQEDVRNLLQTLREKAPESSLVETHISWVLLTPAYAYKVKKPLKFSFLDFSTSEKRRYYCEEELRLNRRLAPEVYLEVLGIFEENDRLALAPLSEEKEAPLDYALKMKRLDNSREMDVLLEKGRVGEKEVKKLAEKLAYFHQKTEKNHKPEFRPREGELFRDLRSVGPRLESWGIVQAANRIEQAIEKSDQIWEKLAERINQRHALGFTVDGHGDLHSGNIFLLDRPVIFDCIEFDEHLRILDVLSELAFLISDLHKYNRPDLVEAFLRAYQNIHPVILTPKDEELMQYYIWYRYNVRLKVTALKAPEGETPNEETLQEIKKLWKLFIS